MAIVAVALILSVFVMLPAPVVVGGDSGGTTGDEGTGTGTGDTGTGDRDTDYERSGTFLDGQLTWTIDDTGKVLTIALVEGVSGPVSMSIPAEAGGFETPWKQGAYKYQIQALYIKGNITSISSSYFFSDMRGLNTVDLSESKITSIASGAFSGSVNTIEPGRDYVIIFPDVDKVELSQGAFVCPFVYNKTDLTAGVNAEDLAGYEFNSFESEDSLYFVRGEASKPATHSVSYDIGEGSGSAPETVTVKQGDTFTVASYDGTREGYEFGGWVDKSTNILYQPGKTVTMGTENIAFTAAWTQKATAKTFTVTFDLAGGRWADGSESASMAYNMGDKVTVSPVRDSYTFSGWSSSDGFHPAGTEIEVNSDMDLKAVWVEAGKSSSMVPIFPGDEQDAIEVLVEDGEKDGSKDDGKTVLVIGIVVAIIAILAVMSIPKR